MRRLSDRTDHRLLSVSSMRRRSLHHGTTALSFDLQTMLMRALPHSAQRQREFDPRHVASTSIDERLEVGVAAPLAGPTGEVHADVFRRAAWSVASAGSCGEIYNPPAACCGRRLEP
jgi:hypothetical protein